MNTQPQPVKPAIPLTDSRFKYTPSCKTDITETWRRFGFTPTPRS